MTFTTLIVANLGLILVNRSWTRTILGTLRAPNAALWWVLGGATLVVLALTLLGFPVLSRPVSLRCPERHGLCLQHRRRCRGSNVV